MAGNVVVGHGPQAVEEAVLRLVGEVRAAGPADLALPVRVVVPSQSLRLHLAGRLVERCGAVAGIVVQTLHGLALEILERAGEVLPGGASAYEILIRRLAALEPALAEGLAHLEDGFGAVTATVRDLLDAGMEGSHHDPLIEQLEALPSGAMAPAVRERARALVRVAALTAEGAERLGVARASTLLARAAALVTVFPEQAAPARAVLVHGFGDATGVAGDLVMSLLRHRDAVVFLDRPLDPADPGREDSGAAFGARFAERLAGVVGSPQDLGRGGGRAVPRVVVARDREAEVRWVARQLRRELERGAPPESLAVVARDLRGYDTVLRRHLDRLGVPFSGLAAKVAVAARQWRSCGLSSLLERGLETPTEQWLELHWSEGHGPLHEVLAGLRALGAVRLGDTAAVDLTALPSAGLPLPVVAGWSLGDEPARVRRRRLPLLKLAPWVDRARQAAEVLGSWPGKASAREHLRRTLRLLAPARARDELARALRDAAADLPAGWYISREEWALVVARAVAGLGAEPVGGRGGGVQLLNVTEARGRTFAVLFVLGLNRDLFPRVVRADPLLPDAVRAGLAAVLPDIPLKERGWDEERHLFAQLVAAAGKVTLSWHANDGGRPAAASPFLERLTLAGTRTDVVAPDPWDDRPRRQGPRPAYEHAILAGLGDDRSRWTGALAAALREGRRRAGSPRQAPSASVVAAARCDLLDEVDPRLLRSDLGPFAGCVGAPTRADDPRRREPSVTLLEGLARCPWRTFLTRLLRMEVLADPFLDLPGADPRLVGMVVHGVLERIVGQGAMVGGTVGEACRRPPRPAPWPDRESLEGLVRGEARRVAAAEGLLGCGVVPALEVLALPFLELAQRHEWEPGGCGPATLGAELEGHLEVGPGGRRVSFRVDRLDRDARGLVFTDYKTGKARTSGKWRRELAQGLMLQVAAYALSETGARGRYLYLNPDQGDDEVSEVVCEADGDAEQALTEAVAAATGALEQGALFPRVEGDNPNVMPEWCRSCSVQEACLRGDLGQRRRLVRWSRREPGEGALERAAHRLWWLGRERPAGAEVVADEEEQEP